MKLVTQLISCFIISFNVVVGDSVLEGIAFPIEDIEVSSSTEGIIQNFIPKEGAYVQKGDLILTYNHAQEDIQLKQATLNFSKSKADLKNAESLAAKGIYTSDNVNNMTYAHDKSKIELEMAKLLRDDKELRAPISGILIKKNIDVGELSNRSQPVCRIINKDALIIELFIDKSLFNKVKKGDVYRTVFPELEDKVVTSEVVFVDSVIDAKSGFLRVKTIIDNTSANIQPGLRAKVFLDKK